MKLWTTASFRHPKSIEQEAFQLKFTLENICTFQFSWKFNLIFFPLFNSWIYVLIITTETSLIQSILHLEYKLIRKIDLK